MNRGQIMIVNEKELTDQDTAYGVDYLFKKVVLKRRKIILVPFIAHSGQGQPFLFRDLLLSFLFQRSPLNANILNQKATSLEHLY